MDVPDRPQRLPGPRGQIALPDNAGKFSSADAPPDRQAQTRQEAALLHRALAELPREKREVLVMSRFLDLKYEEIASVLKCEVERGPARRRYPRLVMRESGRQVVKQTHQLRVQRCELADLLIGPCIYVNHRILGGGPPQHLSNFLVADIEVGDYIDG